VTERSEIRFGNTRIPFHILRSERRATVALAIDDGRLVVTAPRGVAVERLDRVVRSKALWVAQHLQNAAPAPAAREREFVAGETFRYLGRQYRLRIARGLDGRDVKLDRGWLVVPAPRSRPAEGTVEVRSALVRWYRQRAEERLPEWVVAWARPFGIAPPGVLIRDQRRRWGSCNRAGEIRLNWRLVQAAPSLIDYVVAHELAHLVGGDDAHGEAFWARLARVMPDYDARRDALRAVGAELEW
jgi:predicted metal-dependent hydrolase